MSEDLVLSAADMFREAVQTYPRDDGTRVFKKELEIGLGRWGTQIIVFDFDKGLLYHLMVFPPQQFVFIQIPNLLRGVVSKAELREFLFGENWLRVAYGYDPTQQGLEAWRQMKYDFGRVSEAQYFQILERLARRGIKL